jgi:hypothetical protein
MVATTAGPEPPESESSVPRPQCRGRRLRLGPGSQPEAVVEALAPSSLRLRPRAGPVPDSDPQASAAVADSVAPTVTVTAGRRRVAALLVGPSPMRSVAALSRMPVGPRTLSKGHRDRGSAPSPTRTGAALRLAADIIYDSTLSFTVYDIICDII